MITLPASNLAMVINTLIVLACIAFFGWRGYQRGVLRTLQRLISILSGYMICYFFAGMLAGLLGSILGLSLFTSYLLGTITLLAGGAFIADYMLSRFIIRDESGGENENENAEFEEDINEELRPPNEREHKYKAGMTVGILLGGFLGLLTVWLGGITMDAIMLNTHNASMLTARTADPVRKIAGAMVGGAVGYVVEQKTGSDSLAPDLAATLIADPVAMSQQIAEISKSDALKEFFSDTSAQALMQENKIEALQEHESFQKLMNTPQTKVFFGVLGSSVKNGEKMTQESRAAHLLTDMYRKARRVQTDARFIALSQKPEYQQLLRNPSPVALFTNPLIKELGDIIFSSSPSVKTPGHDQSFGEGTDQRFQSVEKPQWEKVDETPGSSTASASADESVVVDDANVIYRWTDEHGQKHFSQTKPEGDYPLEIIKSQ